VRDGPFRRAHGLRTRCRRWVVDGVPADTWHDAVNTGEEPMRLYAVYAPVHHPPGITQATSGDAERNQSG